MALAGPPTSIQRTHFVYGPVSEDCFSVDVLLGYEAPHAAVVGLVPMIAEHVVVAGLDVHRWISPMIQVLRQNVILVKGLVVDVNNTTPNLDDVTRHSDHALDVRLRGIEGIPENDNILPLDFFDPVDELVDEDALLVDQLRQHAGPFDFDRLVEENDDHDRCADGEKDVAGPSANFADYVRQCCIACLSR